MFGNDKTAAIVYEIDKPTCISSGLGMKKQCPSIWAALNADVGGVCDWLRKSKYKSQTLNFLEANWNEWCSKLWKQSIDNGVFVPLTVISSNSNEATAFSTFQNACDKPD